MDKYRVVYDMVLKLTEDTALRTFFTLYLMADEEAERDKIDAEFWVEIKLLPESEQTLIKQKLRDTLRTFRIVVDEWGTDVEHFIAQQTKQAA